MDISNLFLNTKDCVNFSEDYKFEVKPGNFSPIYIDLKATLQECNLRRSIVDGLTSIISPDVDYICGVESGGSYYASAVADRLGKKLILFRTKGKSYGLKKFIVGREPEEGSKVVVIDDVLATGTTVGKVCNYIKGLGAEVIVRNIFSYGFDREVSDKLGFDIRSVIYFDDLVSEARAMNILPKRTEKIISSYLITYLDLI